MSARNPFVALRPGTELALTETDRFARAGYWWSRPEIDALILAHAARRPLLVRGEAGSGKSQIARAAAQVLGGAEPLCEVIHPPLRGAGPLVPRGRRGAPGRRADRGATRHHQRKVREARAPVGGDGPGA